jgi:hypothetical protein
MHQRCTKGVGVRPFRVFYSWQSDMPKTNRNFIQGALEHALTRAGAAPSGVVPVLDRDTKGVAGTPDIVETILRKIENADAIVADVSLIVSAFPPMPTKLLAPPSRRR